MLAWYLSYRLWRLTLLLFVFFALLDISIALVQELGQGFWFALGYALLQQPSHVVLLLPSIWILAGILFFFNLLADRRLAFLQGLGWSSWDFYRHFWIWLLFLLVFLLIWTEWVVPQSARAATLWKAQAIAGTSVARLGENLWLKHDQEFIRVGGLLPDGRLQDLTIYRLAADSQQLAEVLSAELAYYDAKAKVWQLKNVKKYQYQAAALRINTWLEYRWQSAFTPEFFQDLLQAPATHSLASLLKIIDFMKNSGLSARAYQWALWQKIGLWLLPFFLFGALWAVLWRLPLTASGWLWLVALVAALALYLGLRLLASMGLAWQWPAALSGLLPSVLLLLLWGRLRYRKT